MNELIVVWPRLILEVFAAFLGTCCFAAIFCVPSKHYLACGIDGAVGWLVYSLMMLVQPSTVIATLVAAIPLTMLARVLAITRRAPVTLFLLCGIFPLVPGAGIYYTAYNFIHGDTAGFMSTGIETLKIACALAISISLVLGMPLPKRKKR